VRHKFFAAPYAPYLSAMYFQCSSCVGVFFNVMQNKNNILAERAPTAFNHKSQNYTVVVAVFLPLVRVFVVDPLFFLNLKFTFF
jgi:hypothetical protein